MTKTEIQSGSEISLYIYIESTFFCIKYGCLLHYHDYACFAMLIMILLHRHCTSMCILIGFHFQNLWCQYVLLSHVGFHRVNTTNLKSAKLGHSIFKFSRTWICVSLPRATTSREWKLLIFVLIWKKTFANLDDLTHFNPQDRLIKLF